MHDASMAQVPVSWHHQGMYMGMHWAWWLFWIATAVLILWAFWRLFAERAENRRDIQLLRATERSLRERLSRNEITEAQFARDLSAAVSGRTRP
jgi:uncharacterized membrane protein